MRLSVCAVVCVYACVHVCMYVNVHVCHCVYACDCVHCSNCVNHVDVWCRFLAVQKPMSYEEVYNQSSPTNCTVYCGGIPTALSGWCLFNLLVHTLFFFLLFPYWMGEAGHSPLRCTAANCIFSHRSSLYLFSPLFFPTLPFLCLPPGACLVTQNKVVELFLHSNILYTI